MNIVTTYYSLKYKSFDIIHSGCDGFCKGCHNQELVDFNQGVYYQEKLPEIVNTINKNSNMIDWIWIYGGEPLLQNEEDLMELMIILITLVKKPIMLWTRFKFTEVPEIVKNCCDYIKTGFYDETKKEKTTYCGVELETSNQKIYKKENGLWIL